MNKNIIYIFSAILLLMGLTACDNKEDALIDSESKTEVDNTPDPGNHHGHPGTGHDDPDHDFEEESTNLVESSELSGTWIISTPYDQPSGGDAVIFYGHIDHGKGQSDVSGYVRAQGDGQGWYDKDKLQFLKSSSVDGESATLVFLGSFETEETFTLKFTYDASKERIPATLTSDVPGSEPVQLELYRPVTDS